MLSSPETLLQWAASHFTLTLDFSSIIRLSRPGGCIGHSGSLTERRRRSPHDQAGSGIPNSQPHDCKACAHNMREEFVNTWKSAKASLPKLEFYNSIKHDFEPKTYPWMIKIPDVRKLRMFKIFHEKQSRKIRSRTARRFHRRRGKIVSLRALLLRRLAWP